MGGPSRRPGLGSVRQENGVVPSLHQLQLPDTPCSHQDPLNAPPQASLNPWAPSPTLGLRFTPGAVLRGVCASLSRTLGIFVQSLDTK